jgi:L-asparaginase II
MRSPADLRPPKHVPLVHLMRDGLVESTHHGSVVLLDSGGKVLAQAGDIGAACYPRSALKPMQAVGMVRAGLDLPPELLALATGSHSGEDFHLAGTRRILDRAGLAESDLGNPGVLPYDPIVRDAWLAKGLDARKLAHTCSGQHASMLLTAVRRGWSTSDYLDPAHPLQQEIASTVEDLTDEKAAHTTIDGCGAPMSALSLYGLTRGIARIAAAAPESPEGLVAQAIRDHPEVLGGTHRDVTRLLRAVPGLIAKDGSEAVQIAALPDGRAIGLKIADGADRARIPLTAAALVAAGVDPALLTTFVDNTNLGATTVTDGLRITAEFGGAATRFSLYRTVSGTVAARNGHRDTKAERDG